MSLFIYSFFQLEDVLGFRILINIRETKKGIPIYSNAVLSKLLFTNNLIKIDTTAILIKSINNFGLFLKYESFKLTLS